MGENEVCPSDENTCFRVMTVDFDQSEVRPLYTPNLLQNYFGTQKSGNTFPNQVLIREF